MNTVKLGCDGGCKNSEIKRVHRVDTGGGSGLFLCVECFEREMSYRKERNAEPYKNAFPVYNWPGPDSEEDN